LSVWIGLDEDAQSGGGPSAQTPGPSARWDPDVRVLACVLWAKPAEAGRMMAERSFNRASPGPQAVEALKKSFLRRKALRGSIANDSQIPAITEGDITSGSD